MTIKINDENILEQMKSGIDKVANVVKQTLGPRGKYVVIEKPYGPPLITSDGASIIEEISLEDQFEALGAEVGKDIARRVSADSGDGRTAAFIITQSIFSQGVKNIIAGAKVIELTSGLVKAKEAVLTYLDSLKDAKPTPEQIAQVASVSSGDENIGKVVATVLEEVGLDGLISVEESRTPGVSSDVVKGFKVDQGYLPPYMPTTNGELTVVEPWFLITDKHITEAEDIKSLAQAVLDNGKKELIIVADNVSDAALVWINNNKTKGTFTILVIKKPGAGEDGKNQLEDMAIFTGTKVISEQMGRKLSEVKVEELGRADKVVTTKSKSIILAGKSDPGAMANRIEQIKQEIESAEADFDKTKLKERLARLNNGIGVIRVGYSTQTQRGVIEKVQDAINAARGAKQEGVVIGGGVSLLWASDIIDSLDLVEDERTGANILKHALQQPIRQLAINSGVDDGVVVDKVKNSKKNLGFNAKTLKYENLVEAGIIDSVKTVKATVEYPVMALATLLNAGSGLITTKDGG